MKKSDVLFLMAAIYFAQAVSKDFAFSLGVGCVCFAFILKMRGH